MSLCGSGLGNWLVRQSRCCLSSSFTCALLFPWDVGTSLNAGSSLGFSSCYEFITFIFYYFLIFITFHRNTFIEILEKKAGENYVSSTTPILATHLHLLSQNVPLAVVFGSYHSAWQLKSGRRVWEPLTGNWQHHWPGGQGKELHMPLRVASPNFGMPNQWFGCLYSWE